MKITRTSSPITSYHAFPPEGSLTSTATLTLGIDGLAYSKNGHGILCRDSAKATSKSPYWECVSLSFARNNDTRSCAPIREDVQPLDHPTTGLIILRSHIL